MGSLFGCLKKIIWEIVPALAPLFGGFKKILNLTGYPVPSSYPCSHTPLNPVWVYKIDRNDGYS